MKAVASLRYGVIFKKAFSPVETFTAFVKDILDIDLQIDQVETEKSFDPPIGSVDSRFDLFAEDKVNRIIVDIQHRRYNDHYHRFLYYHCAALLQQAVNSKDYRPALQVYTIVILTSGDHHQRDMSVIDFDPKDRDGMGIGEIPHKILYLCPKYVDEKTPEAWREWLLAIEDSLDGEIEETDYHKPSVQNIIHCIEKDAITPQEYARMKDEHSEELLRFNEVDVAEKRGLEKGKLAEKQETARRMLSKGMTIEAVAELVELPIVIVQSLK